MNKKDKKRHDELLAVLRSRFSAWLKKQGIRKEDLTEKEVYKIFDETPISSSTKS